ncbi:MAG: YIP1 family protein [Caldilineaceae bacterium]|nr:YIP1 family protein [Caldilineaceae bacterium]
MFEYLWSVWRAIQLGLRLQPDVVQIAETHPNATWIAFGVVMVAGVSVLLGQSVILFLNQVRPGRFIMSLVSNGVLLVVGWVVWSATVWGTGQWLFTEQPDFAVVLRLTGLSYAPLVYGFLILMPYLGPFVQRLLYAWSLIIALRAVAFAFQVGFWPALLCVGLGWLLLMLLTATIGRPIVTVRNWVWHRITGTPMDASAHELLRQFAIEKSSPSTTKRDQS